MARVNARGSVFWVATLLLGLLVGSTLVGGASAAPAGPPGGLEVAEQNLDPDGNIKVHEQGVAQVDVTNGSFDVNVIDFPANQDVTVTNTPLRVDVTDWPATQNVDGTVSAQQSGIWNVGINGTPNVNVVNEMTFTLAPASRSTTADFSIDDDDDWVSFPIDPVLFASTIIIESNDEAVVIVSGPLGSFDVGFTNDDLGRMAVSLIQPYPVESISVKCFQSTFSCFGSVILIGS